MNCNLSFAAKLGIILGSVGAVVVCVVITLVLLYIRFRGRVPRFRANEDQEEIINRNEDESPVEL